MTPVETFFAWVGGIAGAILVLWLLWLLTGWAMDRGQS